MIIAAKMAAQKFSTSSFSLQRETSINIAAFTTTKKRPKVKITAGKVNNFNNDPSVAFSRPNKSATHRYVVKPPLTSIPGIRAVATQKESAKAAQRTNNFMQ